MGFSRLRSGAWVPVARFLGVFLGIFLIQGAYVMSIGNGPYADSRVESVLIMLLPGIFFILPWRRVKTSGLWWSLFGAFSCYVTAVLGTLLWTVLAGNSPYTFSQDGMIAIGILLPIISFLGLQLYTVWHLRHRPGKNLMTKWTPVWALSMLLLVIVLVGFIFSSIGYMNRRTICLREDAVHASLAVALEHYRADHNRYPESLDELKTKGYLGCLPTSDNFQCLKQYQYMRTSNSYRLVKLRDP